MSDSPPELGPDFEGRWSAVGATEAELGELGERFAASRRRTQALAGRLPLPMGTSGRTLAAQADRRRRRRVVRGRVAGVAVLAAVCAVFAAVPFFEPHSEPVPPPALAEGRRMTPAGPATSDPDPKSSVAGPASPAAVPTTPVISWRPEPALLAASEGRVELGSESRARRDGAGTIHLETGALRVEVAPRRSGAPLRFRAGHLTVEVVGTIFALRVEAGRGSVRVYEGAVLVETSTGARVRIDATSGAPPGQPRWLDESGRSLDAWGVRAALRREAEKAASAALPREAEKPASAVLPREAEKPASAALPREAEKPASAAPLREAETRAEPGPTPRAPRRAALSARRGLGPARTEAVPRAELELAESRPNVPSRADELALYRSGLSRLRAREPREAAEIFADYLARFPAGMLTEEASLYRLQALRAAEVWSQLEVEAAAWLGAHADDPRAAEVRALLESRPSSAPRE